VVLPLSKNSRLDIARDHMRQRNLDALVVYSQRRAHIAYLSGYRPNYHTNSAFLVLPLVDEPVLLIKFGFDMPRARSMSWVRDIRPGHSEDVRCLFFECAEIFKEKKLSQGRLGWVTADDVADEMSHTLLRAMKEALPGASLEPASDLARQMRLSKEPEEVELLRRCTQVCELAADAFTKAVAPGVEDFAAVAQATAAAVAAGANRYDMIISLDPADVSLPPRHKHFLAGKPVSFELTTEYEGYWIQICRTLSIGPPSPLQKRVFAACRDGYDAAVSAAKVGARAADVARAATDVVEKAGFAGCIRYGIGHGIGLDIPEPCSIDVNSSGLLSDQMALILHPSIWTEGASGFVGGPIIVDSRGPVVLDHPQREMIEV
jgi:Xaa-Pro aminopeptidase